MRSERIEWSHREWPTFVQTENCLPFKCTRDRTALTNDVTIAGMLVTDLPKLRLTLAELNKDATSLGPFDSLVAPAAATPRTFAGASCRRVQC